MPKNIKNRIFCLFKKDEKEEELKAMIRYFFRFFYAYVITNKNDRECNKKLSKPYGIFSQN